jgi:hypothetical protein
VISILGILALSLAVRVPAARAGTFTPAPIAPEAGVERLNRAVAREKTGRDLFAEPYATVTISNVDLYDRFPYVESRDFQVVSDPRWNRLVFGERGRSLAAWNGEGTSLGALSEPRGLAVDESGRVYVADTGNDRIVVLQSHTRFGTMTLEPLFAVAGFSGPWDVAFSDAGTPFVPGDDRLYVVDTGRNRVVAFALESAGVRALDAVGELGSGPGRFAGPLAVAAGRGAAAHDLYVADAHTRRIVHLRLESGALRWVGEAGSEADVVTSLDTDAWGNVYAAAPQQGVVRKYNPALVPVADLREGLARPRGFHVPFLNVNDHRDGSRTRVGQGRALTVDEWAGPGGIALWTLGTAVSDLTVRGGETPEAAFTLTDRSYVSLELVDAASGRAFARRAVGALDAGPQRVALAQDVRDAAGVRDAIVRVTATSSYHQGGADVAQAHLALSGAAAVAPARPVLIGNAPNPVTTSTRIQYLLPANARRVTLALFDAQGRRVRTFEPGVAPGLNEIVWDGSDDRGRAVGAGVYLYRLDVDDASFTSRLSLVRRGS